MRRIAHLSDVHILDKQVRRSGARYRFATKFVSLGRAIDPRLRARKLARALAAAKDGGADHVVISGDLTEVGEASEFEHFAEVLDDARLPEGSVTLVPGNHDAYTSGGAWAKALAGPLRRFAAASATDPGKVVDRGSVALLPIDTTRFQSMARAGGQFSADAAGAVARRLVDPAFAHKALVLVLHHPPFTLHRTPMMQWVDGLRGGKHLLELLQAHPRLSILHGHLHRAVDRIIAGARTRVFGAPATCDDREDGLPRVRFYDVHAGELSSAGIG